SHSGGEGRQAQPSGARSRAVDHKSGALWNSSGAPAIGSLSKGQRPSPGGSVTIADFGPIHHVPPCFEIVGAAVLVFKVIGVLPDVVPKQNTLAVHQRAVLVWPRFDRKPAPRRDGYEHPA